MDFSIALLLEVGLSNISATKDSNIRQLMSTSIALATTRQTTKLSDFRSTPKL